MVAGQMNRGEFNFASNAGLPFGIDGGVEDGGFSFIKIEMTNS
jgi:hypothetical protein